MLFQGREWTTKGGRLLTALCRSRTTDRDVFLSVPYFIVDGVAFGFVLQRLRDKTLFGQHPGLPETAASDQLTDLAEGVEDAPRAVAVAG